jgi:hypothetical protein
MPDGGAHCPFLNRADARCAGYMSLDALRHSYNYCFGNYPACQVYGELLAERRMRRAEGLQMAAPVGTNLLTASRAGANPGTNLGRLIQVSVGRTNMAMAAAPVSAAPQTPRGRWGLWRSVRRGIAAGFHLRLVGSSDAHEDASTVGQTAIPSAARVRAGQGAITPLAKIAPAPGLRARVG